MASFIGVLCNWKSTNGKSASDHPLRMFAHSLNYMPIHEIALKQPTLVGTRQGIPIEPPMQVPIPVGTTSIVYPAISVLPISLYT